MLAGSTYTRCSSPVFFYAPSSSNKGKPEQEDNTRSNDNAKVSKNCLISSTKDHQGKVNNISSKSRIKMNGADHRGIPIKSNLKKYGESNQTSRGIKKVTWPDDHGNHIAQVQEYEPSVSDDGELGGVRNACVCLILLRVKCKKIAM